MFVSYYLHKFLRASIFNKICKQLLLQFLLLTVNIFSQELLFALNSVSLFSSRSCLRFKEFPLESLVVDSSLIRKKEELAEMATRCHSSYHSYSLVVSLVVIRCHSLSLDVPLVCLFINDISIEAFAFSDIFKGYRNRALDISQWQHRLGNRPFSFDFRKS